VLCNGRLEVVGSTDGTSLSVDLSSVLMDVFRTVASAHGRSSQHFKTKKTNNLRSTRISQETV